MCFASVSLFAQTFTGATGPISDNICDATHDFPVTVSGIGVLGTTNNFSSVGFSITHTWDSDLDIYLVAPDGTTIVELSTDNGGNGDNYTNTVISATGTSAITAGVAPFTGTYTPEGSLAVLNSLNADGTWILRVCDDAAGDIGTLDSWSITFTPVIFDLPDYANLQFPDTATIVQGGNVTVYGQVYEPGVTPGAGAGAGIQAWVGVSPIGSNTNPNTWTSWTAATYNVDLGNNDEYQSTIGATLPIGTYYYATRFSLNGGAYVYGGYSPPPGGGFWDGTTYNSGILTVNPPPPPVNDDCAGAIALTPGGVFADNAVSGTLLGATTTSGIIPTCQTSVNSDVWYTVVVPASGNLTIETQVSATTTLTDTVVVAYTGTGICGGTLAQVGCDDDGGLAGANNFMSVLSLTGQTPSSTLYIGVWKFGTAIPSSTSKDYVISAYDGSLGNSSFDNANFAFYPNPVKNILNLSYNQEISSVEVFNLLGQKVNSNKINANSAQIDMSNLSKGAYMVKVTSNDQVKTIKVIKE